LGYGDGKKSTAQTHTLLHRIATKIYCQVHGLIVNLFPRKKVGDFLMDGEASEDAPKSGRLIFFSRIDDGFVFFDAVFFIRSIGTSRQSKIANSNLYGGRRLNKGRKKEGSFRGEMLSLFREN
jgi:hypothetical protein